jgi:hypothetical protein
MFTNLELQNHLETSSTIRSQSAIIAEWNMNIPTNIYTIGNYRYRKNDTSSDYRSIPNEFFKNDEGNNYTNATDADIVIDGGFKDNDLPTTLTLNKDKLKMLYSLEDCFKPFRPRSGINKAAYFPGSYQIHNANSEMAKRPRYYMPDKNDGFKYWTSFRTEGEGVYGISNQQVSGQNTIDDTAPFIVYENNVPANRVVVKMQTHVGDIDLGPFSNKSGSFNDPYYGDANKATPINWKVQTLKGDKWVDIAVFNQNTKRKDGTDIIKSDGYVELSYGLQVPDKFAENFVYSETYSSVNLLPDKAIIGYAYLIQENENDLGDFYVWTGEAYEVFSPEYGWALEEETVDRLTNFVTDLTAPVLYTNPVDGSQRYREFEYLRGIRLVVETMNKPNCTFDLIEISPRLTVNLTDKTLAYSVNKTASDLGVSGMPVGQLLASNGSVELFDYDDAFNENNSLSIIKNYISRYIQFKFYEIILDVGGYDYYIPIKTMYSDGFPTNDNSSKTVSIELRDMYFYLESLTAPQILLTNVSVSSAVSLLLDSIGFSNYIFKRVANESEATIPFFFIKPDTNIAEVLQSIAVSTQTAMFFDEYNNFIMMSKDYIMPTASQRETDLTLYGSSDMEDSSVYQNKTTKNKIANILEISSQDNQVYNDGVINYTSRYIQKSEASIQQAMLVDDSKNWVYKPALLWEVSGTEKTKSINDESGSSTYTLAAIPLNSNLTDEVPKVVNNALVNNVMDLGEAVFYLSRNNGYFYSNGEVIKFDAVEYNIPGAEKIVVSEGENGQLVYNTTTTGQIGNVWITNSQEYERYFSQLAFNGKIYPTGRVRIYSEPNYEEVSGVLRLKNGPVAKHGRGQFGTKAVEHYAGINPYWFNNDYIRGCTMKSEYLFSEDWSGSTTLGDAGINNPLAQKTTRNSIIKNILSSTYIPENETNTLRTAKSGSVQASALVMNGPSFTTTEKAIDFISYVYKPLDNRYKHFGTRMRIIGKLQNNENNTQTAVGNTTYYTVDGTTPDKSIAISGGSGGLAFLLNPSNNNGYYFEIIGLGSEGFTKLNKENAVNVNNIMFYKIKKSGNDAIPVKLWEGLGAINIDPGLFTGLNRMTGDENVSVYDLSAEYVDNGSIRTFYLYINNNLIATVNDTDPLPTYNNMAMFVRGSSKVMFENIYAITNNYAQNSAYSLNTPVNSIFNDGEINVNEAFRKYSMSGVVQGTHLSGISPSDTPAYNIYFDEFGSIMREAAAFNIKYDKAYPALFAKLTPTYNRVKGYTVSGFRAGAYGAEFLIFNATDTIITLDQTNGNYLQIQGITFTQQSSDSLTVDKYFSKNSDFSNPQFIGNNLISSPFKVKKDYEDIKLSRMTYGKKDFSLDVEYIQTDDDANNLMKWIISKIMKPRKSIGVKVFSMPILQLGDIVSVDYNQNGIDIVGSADKRFVVYNIEYSKSKDGPDMSVYLSEVL